MMLGTKWLANKVKAFRRGGPMNLIIGNEACDCDSVISALTWAYRMDVMSSLDNDISYIPIISCNKADWVLRREAQYLLSSLLVNEDSGVYGLNDVEQSLLFIDDLKEADLLSNKNISITLVDHNELPSSSYLYSIGFSDRVTQIIDHHKDSGKHEGVKGDNRLIVFDMATMKGVGSTCTLVAESLLDYFSANTNDSMPENVSEMLLSTILLDTVNLDPKAGRTTEQDIVVVEKLSTIIKRSKPDLSFSKIYDHLMALKTDPVFWKQMSVSQAVGFDFKGLKVVRGSDGAEISVGTSAIMAHLHDFLSNWSDENIGLFDDSSSIARFDKKKLLDIKTFCTENKYDFLLLLSMVVDPVLTREAALVSINSLGGDVIRAVGDVMMSDSNMNLKEARVDSSVFPEGVFIRYFKQGNVKVTRKQHIPFITEAIKSL